MRKFSCILIVVFLFDSKFNVQESVFMKQWRILLKKTVGQVIATMAVAIATVTANSTCTMWIYEDKESAKLKELRKF